jgi:phosphosulfolactate synthase (CoM biosynthesis protein A)
MFQQKHIYLLYFTFTLRVAHQGAYIECNMLYIEEQRVEAPQESAKDVEESVKAGKESVKARSRE